MKETVEPRTIILAWLLVAAVVVVAGIATGAFKAKAPVVTRITDGVRWMPEDVPPPQLDGEY